MKLSLFEFQKTALDTLREKVTAARKSAGIINPQAIALSAPTGSGKTIIMTAFFEAILEEPDDQLDWPPDWKPQPDAVILWLSDVPELNEQTRLKIESKSDRIYQATKLITVDSTFDAERFEGGHIYFMNTQKLGTDKLLTKVADGRNYSIWTTLTNTAKAIPDRFYVVIDEAHRGMSGGSGAKEAQTLMQRFLLGYPDEGLVRMPLVIGVSATVKRFTELIGNADHTTYKVNVPADDVRKSGLLKDRVLIHHPETAATAEMSLLEEAARRWAEMTAGWGAYCNEQGDSTVWPILVVQVENASAGKVTRTNLSSVLDTIEKAIGRSLKEGEVAHAMHDSGDLDIDGRKVTKVEASRIEEDKAIGVVIFKTSLSTGWDCPRAEVMMSFRKAEDHTYIAQLLGRMVRTPLARRVESNAALNDVHLFIPHFDSGAVTSVITDLRNEENVPPSDIESSADSVVLHRRKDAPTIFKVLEGLVTYRLNAVRVQKDLRRYIALARALTHDGIDASALNMAGANAIGWMKARINELANDGGLEATKKAMLKVGVKTVAVTGGVAVPAQGGSYAVDASEIDIDRLFEEAGRTLGNGLHRDYWRDQEHREAIEVKVEVVALAENHAAMNTIEKLAEDSFNHLYDEHKGLIGTFTEAQRARYERLRLAAATASDIPWHLPESIPFNRAKTAPAWERHIYVETNGGFRCELGGWEKALLEEELADKSVVGWLRNVPRKDWSLQVPYESAGETKPMFPDFVVARKTPKGIVIDVLEPHNSSLKDSFEKAAGMAKFAVTHGHRFGRIEMVRQKTSPAGGKHFVHLDFNKEANRQALQGVSSNAQLDSLFDTLAT